MSLTFLPKTILELGFQTKEILPFFIEFWWGDVRNLKTVLNSAKFLFKALCAKEKVTFVIKNTYRHCNWSASFEASKYLGGKPSYMSETFNERLVQKPSQQISSRL